jgi:amino acid efflux transporter
VLVLPGIAGSIAGPLSLLAWLILVLWSYPFALVFARMSVASPKAGGVAEFVQQAFGVVWGRRATIFLLLTLVIANPLLGLAAGRYLAAVVAPGATNREILAIGFGIILATVVTNTLGLRIGARIQGLLLSALIVFLLVAIASAIPTSHVAALTPVAPHGWAALGPALLVCFFGFIGWENAAPVAEEVEEPEKTFPRAIALAVTAVGLLYLLMAFTIVVHLSRTSDRAEGITAFSNLLRSGFGENGATVGAALAFVLMTLTANAWTLGTSRVVYAAGRAGLLPPGLGRVDSHGTPRAAVLFLAPAYGVIVAGLIVVNRDESTLVTLTSASFLVIFLGAVLAGERILDNRMRIFSRAVAIVTLVLLPFFGTSLPWAFLIAAVAAVLEGISHRSTRRAELRRATGPLPVDELELG